jgi:hypothetical protein
VLLGLQSRDRGRDLKIIRQQQKRFGAKKRKPMVDVVTREFGDLPVVECVGDCQ